MENKQNNTHKNRKHKRNNKNITCNNSTVNKSIESIKSSKTLQKGLTLIKDTALGIGSLMLTAFTEVTDAIKSITNKK